MKIKLKIFLINLSKDFLKINKFKFILHKILKKILFQKQVMGLII